MVDGFLLHCIFQFVLHSDLDALIRLRLIVGEWLMVVSFLLLDHRFLFGNHNSSKIVESLFYF